MVVSESRELRTVGILENDPFVGRMLEILLRGAGFRARFLLGSASDAFATLLDDIDVVVLGPNLFAQRRRQLLDHLAGNSDGPMPRALELVIAAHGGPPILGRQVAWPCSLDDLISAINAATLHPEGVDLPDAVTP
jgi:hypothetical protein